MSNDATAVEKGNVGIFNLDPTLKKILLLIIAFLVLFSIVMIPTPNGLTVAGQRAIAVAVFAFVLWVTQSVNIMVSSIMILAAAAALNVGSTKVILGGFSTAAPMIMLGAFLISAGVNECGLGKRIALYILRSIGGKGELFYAAFFIISTILSPLIPAAAGRAALLLPLGIGVLETVGASKPSNLGKLVMIGGIGFAQGIASNMFLTAMAGNFLAMEILKQATGKDITYGAYFLAGIPMTIIPAVIVYLVLRWFYPPEKITAMHELKEFISKEHESMGRITRGEKYCLSVIILAVLCWIMNFPAAWVVALTAGALMQLPGIGVVTWKKAKNVVPWQMFFLFGAAISMGSLLFETKAVVWIIDNTLMSWGIGNWSWIMSLGLILLAVHIIHMGIISSAAMNSFLLAPFIVFASNVGWDPTTLTLILLFNIHLGHILPISLEPSMITLAAGYHEFNDLFWPGLLMTAIWIILSIGCVAFWPWLNLF